MRNPTPCSTCSTIPTRIRVWVVGTRRIRAVDPDWPKVGAQFHHAVGTAAGELHDSSKILARARPEHLELEVRFRPTGVARVHIGLTPTEAGTEIVLKETPTQGPAALATRAVTDLLLSARNALSLRRLRREVEDRRHRRVS